MSEYYLEIHGVSKAFQAVQALDNVELRLRPGEIKCLAGENGCGKSTLIKIISGVYTPDSGEIIIKGKKYTSLTPMQSIAAGIQVIYQDFSLFPNLSVAENITMGYNLFHKNRFVNKKRNRELAKKVIEEIGINLDLDMEVRKLSVGEKQVVAICRALLLDAELIIMDEPTTALDVTIQAKILELIRSIQKERGISVIYITHDLGVVAKVADYVDVMYAGKIVETGTIDEIFYDPKHPYTWGLLSAMPDLDTADDRLYTIPGSPPNLLHEKPGDAFAPRNRFALHIDDEVDPPMFKISETHYAATWLLDPRAPKVEMPPELKDRVARMSAEAKKIEEAE